MFKNYDDNIHQVCQTVRHLDLIRPYGFSVEAECLWRIREAAQRQYIAMIVAEEKQAFIDEIIELLIE